MWIDDVCIVMCRGGEAKSNTTYGVRTAHAYLFTFESSRLLSYLRRYERINESFDPKQATWGFTTVV